MINSLRLRAQLSYLKANGLLPKQIEVGKLGSFFVVNIFDLEERPNEILKGNVCTGMSGNNVVAWLKGLNEWIERKAFLENKAVTPERFGRESDGCASYPRVLNISGSYKKIARDKARSEAVERFVWAKWWDGKTAAKVTTFSRATQIFREAQMHMSDEMRVESIFEIRPEFVADMEIEVVILLLKMDGFGYISGGSAGPKSERHENLERAFVELVRHCVGFKRMVKLNYRGESFYDRRLRFFASGNGNDLVEERLKSNSADSICLNPVKYDSELMHSLAKISYVHHFMFEDQPEFLEGKLERLCL